MRYLLVFLLFLLSVTSISARTRLTTLSSSKLVIHTGSYSIDYNNLTQSEIDAHVLAIVSAIPNTTHIAVGTYLDYDNQLQMWANSIRSHGKKVFFRSAGFNAWQQTNGETYVMTPLDHIVWTATVVRLHPTIFASGDIFEPVPDEPENGTYWHNTYGHSGIGTNQASKDEFNQFIQDSIISANNVFSEMGIMGVRTDYVFTNPSVAKDIINSTTASMIVVGTDNYPENGLTTPAQMANAMQAELNTWAVPAHPTRPKHITFGPSVYSQLTQKVQKDAYNKEFLVIKNTIIDLDGVTIWQSGATWNPLSRIFEYNGTWQARLATGAINLF